jgi:hypothetical protein
MCEKGKMNGKETVITWSMEFQFDSVKRKPCVLKMVTQRKSAWVKV